MDKRQGLRADNKVLEYFLNKHRDQLQANENKRRKELKMTTNTDFKKVVNFEEFQYLLVDHDSFRIQAQGSLDGMIDLCRKDKLFKDCFLITCKTYDKCIKPYCKE